MEKFRIVKRVDEDGTEHHLPQCKRWWDFFWQPYSNYFTGDADCPTHEEALKIIKDCEEDKRNKKNKHHEIFYVER